MKAVCTECQTAVPAVNLGHPESPRWVIIPHVMCGKEHGPTCQGHGDSIQMLVAEHPWEKATAWKYLNDAVLETIEWSVALVFLFTSVGFAYSWHNKNLDYRDSHLQSMRMRTAMERHEQIRTKDNE